jgi:hypothetical protein
MTSRISRLTCTSCGTEQRVKIEQTEGGELCSPCNACGGRDFASWPHLEEPAAPVFDFTEVPTERLEEFMRAVFGEYKDDE